jgi:hypothetical protein
MGGDVPSGLVGKPDNPDEYVPIEIVEWGRRYGTIYVARNIWEGLKPTAQELTFYIQDWGRFRLFFDRPVGRLQA